MLSDDLTKPKQGQTFLEMRAELMICPVIYKDVITAGELNAIILGLPKDQKSSNLIPKKQYMMLTITSNATSQECVDVLLKLT